MGWVGHAALTKSWPEDFEKRNYDGVLSVDGSTKLRETDAKIWTGCNERGLHNRQDISVALLSEECRQSRSKKSLGVAPCKENVSRQQGVAYSM
jgi:hypothetical protein